MHPLNNAPYRWSLLFGPRRLNTICVLMGFMFNFKCEQWQNDSEFLHFQLVQVNVLAKETDGINGKLNHIWQS